MRDDLGPKSHPEMPPPRERCEPRDKQVFGSRTVRQCKAVDVRIGKPKSSSRARPAYRAPRWLGQTPSRAARAFAHRMRGRATTRRQEVPPES